jgi:hypothetical protein
VIPEPKIRELHDLFDFVKESHICAKIMFFNCYYLKNSDELINYFSTNMIETLTSGWFKLISMLHHLVDQSIQIEGMSVMIPNYYCLIFIYWLCDCVMITILIYCDHIVDF